MRAHSKRLDELAVLLWIDGWEVPLARVRKALHAYAPAPRPVPKGAARDELDWQLGELAYKIAPRIKARFGRRGVDREQIADAVLPILQLSAGLRGRIRKRDAEVVEAFTGIERGRSDSVSGVEPWLLT